MARGKRRGTIVPLDPEPGCRRWLVRVSTGKDLETGKYGRLNRVVRGPKKDAETVLTELLGHQDQGLTIAKGQETLGQWLETSLGLSTLGPQTIHRNRAAFKQVPALLQSRKLRELTPALFQKLYAELRTAGKAPGTVRYLHAAISSRLGHAVKLKKLARSPMEGVEPPRAAHIERTTLTAGQMASLLKATVDDRLGALWSVLVLGGLRPEEALALRWADYNGQTLQVRRALVWLPKGAPQFETTKGKRARAVPLPATCQRALQRHRAAQNEERLRAGAGYLAGDLIFASPLGRPMRWQTAARAMKVTFARHGLPALRPYDLRHTCATLLLEAGIPAKVVQERLGHASIAITLDVYSHVTETMQADANDRLEAMAEPTPGQRFGNQA